MREEDSRGDVLCPVSPRTMMAKSACTARRAMIIMSSMLATWGLYCGMLCVGLLSVNVVRSWSSDRFSGMDDKVQKN